MSPPSLPLWVRGVAAVLALVASWWLVHTEPIHRLLGDSVAALSVGVVAAFVLRGMHQPLGLWPAREARRGFSMRWALIVPAAAVVLIGVSGASDAVSAAVRNMFRNDLGLMLLVVVGTVAWSLGLGLVRQQPYLRWYAVAAACGLAPPLVAWVVEARALPTASGSAGMLGLFGFLFWSVANTSRILVTEELAFRRLLIGRPEQAGVALVLVSAFVSALWLPLVREGVSWIGPGVLNAFLVGVVAGCLYVLSRSLLLAALFHGLYRATVISTIGAEGITRPGVSLVMLLATGMIGAVLMVLVVQQRGWLPQLQPQAVRDVVGD